jgi:hypothetical protein
VLLLLAAAAAASAWAPRLAAAPAPLHSSYAHDGDSEFRRNVTALRAALAGHRRALLIICRTADRLAQHWTALIDGGRELRMPVFFLLDGLRRDADSQTDRVWAMTEGPPGAQHAYALTLNASGAEANGFRGVSLVATKDAALGWDKALLWACRYAPPFALTLLMEDDVLVPSVHALHALASLGDPPGDPAPAPAPDLLIRAEWRSDTGTGNDNWRSIALEFPPPYYYSMVAAVGVSQALLGALSAYAARNGKLDYVEALLGSVARQANLTVLCPPALGAIFAGGVDAPSCEAVRAAPDALWHAVRNQAEFLARCAEAWRDAPQLLPPPAG